MTHETGIKQDMCGSIIALGGWNGTRVLCVSFVDFRWVFGPKCFFCFFLNVIKNMDSISIAVIMMGFLLSDNMLEQ